MALVGASPKPGSYGRGMIDACRTAGFEGTISLVNPGYDRIDDLVCYPDMKSLPQVPDHAVLMVANARIEQALSDVIAAGIKAATIFGSGYLDDGNPVPLLDRLKARAREAGLLVCGGNGSGFYNRAHKVRFQMGGSGAQPAGPVTFISQSGSIWAAVNENDGRLAFNLTVSSGQEIATDVADYMDFALGLESTRAIGLFIETVRSPENFIAVLERAAEADVPVVVNKVGRSEASKRFAISHSGAIAGDAAVYDAVFKRYGVLSVDDPDELVATLQLLSCGKRARGSGSVVAITDSGGERELLTDIASEHAIPFADLTEPTKDKLSGRLEYGLTPENPLDAWGTGHGFEDIFHDCMQSLLADPNAALGIWVADLRDGTRYHEHYAAAAARIAATSDKPLAFATCYAKARNTDLAIKLRDAGVPVLEGMRPAMLAARAALDYRSFRDRPASAPPAPPPEEVVDHWQKRCMTGAAFDEAEGLALLAAFGIPVAAHRLAASRDEAVAAAAAIGFPVVLKTAEPGIHHKSDVGGVRLRLADREAVGAVYDEMAARLGSRVLLAEMAPPGAEIALGFVADPQFGAVAMISAGGILIEVLKDAVLAIPPFDAREANGLIDRLAMRKILDGVRGKPALDVEALAQTFARFSVMIALLGEFLAEVDVNPLIVGERGVWAVDALIVPRRPQ
ncbi:MAG TPA: acetate--CoA ligase family protein [Nordella sp.]|nr:acetate--CoA ligase family protein [Nordella sp.]